MPSKAKVPLPPNHILIPTEEWEAIREALHLAIQVGTVFTDQDSHTRRTVSMVRKWQDVLDRQRVLDDRILQKAINLVCDTYMGVTPEKLMSRCRTAEVALARHVAMYLVWQKCGYQLTAEKFERSKSTIEYAVQQIRNRIRLEGFQLPI